MLTYWCNCIFLDLLRKAAAIFPPEVITLQHHHSTIISVARYIIGSVGTPVRLRYILTTVGPGPMAFIACVEKILLF
jgi:hypothetical protein